MEKDADGFYSGSGAIVYCSNQNRLTEASTADASASKPEEKPPVAVPTPEAEGGTWD